MEVLKKEDIDKLLKMGYSDEQIQEHIDYIIKFDDDFKYMRSHLVRFIVDNLMYDTDLFALYSALSYWTAVHEIMIRENATKKQKHLVSKDRVDAVLQELVDVAEVYHSNIVEKYEKEKKRIDINDKRSLK